MSRVLPMGLSLQVVDVPSTLSGSGHKGASHSLARIGGGWLARGREYQLGQAPISTVSTQQVRPSAIRSSFPVLALNSGSRKASRKQRNAARSRIVVTMA